MAGKIFVLFAGFVFSSMVSAGLFDGIKDSLKIVNETLDGVSQQVDDIGQEVEGISQQVDDLNAEFDDIGNEFSDIKTKSRDIAKPRRADTGKQVDASTLDASRFIDDNYSFDIKRIRLGEPLRSLKEKYPAAKMMGQDPASYLPDPANENLRVKMVGDAKGTQYVSLIYLRQDLGASTRSSCESRVQSLEARLTKKYGTDTRKAVKKDGGGTSYLLSWEKTVPGSSTPSRLYSKATCSNGAAGKLDFVLVAKGEYIEEAVAAQRRRGGGAVAQEMEADF